MRRAAFALAAAPAAGAAPGQPLFALEAIPQPYRYFKISNSGVLQGDRFTGTYWTPGVGARPMPPPSGYEFAVIRGASPSGLGVGVAQIRGQMNRPFVFDPSTGESRVYGEGFFTENSYGTGVADDGTLVGTQSPFISNDPARAWRLRPGGEFEWLEQLRPGDRTEAHFVNSSGLTAGISVDFTGGYDHQAVLWQPDGTLVVVPRYDANHQLDPRDVTESGFVAGTAVGGGTWTSWLRRPDGSIFVIPHPERQDYSTGVLALNERLEAVGITGNGRREVGMYWSEATGSRYLDDLLLPGLQADWVIAKGWDVNDRGQVLANAQYRGGQYFTVVLTPVPEPGLLAALARRRRGGASAGSGHL
ncbi:MAG: hypothetical protein IT207_04180 [Fimbriimonadaceae bacterium]|nr:hypothetical protein [Fimbriimonadaceae bacterium]